MNWITENFHDEVQFGFPKGELLFSEQSPFQKVEIYETPTHGKVLLNDGCFMLSDRDEAIYHEMMAHVPCFLHPEPKTALVIGGGDGGTAREILRHPSIQNVILVEIDEAVVRASKQFLPKTAIAFQNPKLKTIIDDGVAWVAREKSKGPQFDIICIDSTDPVGFAQPLFGEEFYSGIKALLKPKGIVVSQAESPFYAQKMQHKLAQVLKTQFQRVHFLNFTNMTYPGGLWSFSFATQDTHPLQDFSPSKVVSSQMNFHYYNSDIHEGCFFLPNFQKENLKEYLNPL